MLWAPRNQSQFRYHRLRWHETEATRKAKGRRQERFLALGWAQRNTMIHYDPFAHVRESLPLIRVTVPRSRG